MTEFINLFFEPDRADTGPKDLAVPEDTFPAMARNQNITERRTATIGVDIDGPPKQQSFRFLVSGEGDALATRPNLSPAAESVYHTLIRVATGEEQPSSLPPCGYWYVSIGYAEIRKQCKISARTVERSIKTLLGAQLLVRTQGNFDSPSTYRLYPAEWLL